MNTHWGKIRYFVFCSFEDENTKTDRDVNNKLYKIEKSV